MRLGAIQCAPLLAAAAALTSASMSTEPTLRIAHASGGTLAIEIRNSSPRTLRLWKESNSWGAGRWRILRVRGGAIEVFFENPNRVFTKNVPAYFEIVGEGSAEKAIDLNDSDWRWRGGEEASLIGGDLIIVLYDVPATGEASRMGVWYGIAATSVTIP